MANRFDVFTQQLFQKDISDCSVEELQNLANDYPYFAPAQYALLIKLKETDYSSYQARLQKAILYYHDPLVFDQFINEEKYVFEFSTKEAPIKINTGIEEPFEKEAGIEVVEEPKPEINTEIHEEDNNETAIETGWEKEHEKVVAK